MANSLIDGQLSLWDIEEVEPKKEAEVVKEEVNNLLITQEQQKYLDDNLIYSNDSVRRIIKFCGGGIGIELIDDSGKYELITQYINKQGQKEFNMVGNAKPTPMCKILYYKQEFELNEIQQEKLNSLKDKARRIIKRKGDESIILELEDKVVSINTIGWALEWRNINVVYEDDEIIPAIIEPTVTNEIKAYKNSEIKVGDKVEVVYKETPYTGEVVNIYGPGNTTVNVIFDGKHTAFYIGKVKKIA